MHSKRLVIGHGSGYGNFIPIFLNKDWMLGCGLGNEKKNPASTPKPSFQIIGLTLYHISLLYRYG